MLPAVTSLTTEHDWRLVGIAGLVCLAASICAIVLFQRARAAQGRSRASWIVLGGVSAGFGIWATHFIVLLAYDPGIGVSYDIGLTALSFAAAAAITCAGLGVAVYVPARWGVPAGGGMVGAGAASMHDIGMWAAELPSRINWSFELLLASIALGMVLGIAALALAVRRNTVRNGRTRDHP
jgi:NO-binding membrane sensor protein with MHYT domain